MNFYYAVRSVFDKRYDEASWNNYIEWSRLTHLQEVVSVDCSLNGDLVENDRVDDDYWKHAAVDELYETGFYTTIEYPIKKMIPSPRFNLLTVLIEPDAECQMLNIPEFEFAGYDLIDKSYGNSALTNCGGFDESFLPKDLNIYGLIDNLVKAKGVQKSLLENNPEEYHADTNVIAIWRHRILGRNT